MELGCPDLKDLEKRCTITEIDIYPDQLVKLWESEVKKPSNIYKREPGYNKGGEFEMTQSYAYNLRGQSPDLGHDSSKAHQPFLFARNDGANFFNPLFKNCEGDVNLDEPKHEFWYKARNTNDAYS